MRRALAGFNTELTKIELTNVDPNLVTKTEKKKGGERSRRQERQGCHSSY